MVQDNKYYIKGSDKNGSKVIETLESYGGVNDMKLDGHGCDILYFINPQDKIIGSTHKRGILGEMLTTHPDWVELYPIPEYKFKTGDFVRLKTDRTNIWEIVECKAYWGNPAYRIIDVVSKTPLVIYENDIEAIDIKNWVQLSKSDNSISLPAEEGDKRLKMIETINRLREEFNVYIGVEYTLNTELKVPVWYIQLKAYKLMPIVLGENMVDNKHKRMHQICGRVCCPIEQTEQAWTRIIEKCQLSTTKAVGLP